MWWPPRWCFIEDKVPWCIAAVGCGITTFLVDTPEHTRLLCPAFSRPRSHFLFQETTFLQSMVSPKFFSNGCVVLVHWRIEKSVQKGVLPSALRVGKYGKSGIAASSRKSICPALFSKFTWKRQSQNSPRYYWSDTLASTKKEAEFFARWLPLFYLPHSLAVFLRNQVSAFIRWSIFPIRRSRGLYPSFQALMKP